MTDKMREEFEEWYKSQAVFHKAHLVPLPNGCYSGFIAETAWRAWQAARTVPEGFVMVPVEPTKGMVMAGYHPDFKYEQRIEMYKAMLSAAPEVKK